MKIGFVTVHVEDLEKSIAFWREVMGLEVERRFPGGPGVEITFGPRTMPSGVRLLQARDIDGLALGFVQEPG
jgi:catechol 2,3-dioxygenase-like lactoylglutathione lyase family enzyme